MKQLTLKVWRLLLGAILVAPLFVFNSTILIKAAQAGEAPVNAAFKTLVDRTDFPIVASKVSRSWLWGPDGFKTVPAESYVEGQGGTRLVQYFDKGRLELTSTNSNLSVTSGLLAKELMTGQLQLGDNKFEQHGPSSQSVAGDPDDTLAPTYGDLGLLFNRPAFTIGTVITTFIGADGTQSSLASLAQYNVSAVQYAPNSTHTIASVFKDFLSSTGIVFVNGQFGQEPLFSSPLYTAGSPLTEPYWTRAKVGGKVQDVLVQGFERRVMTYTPANPTGYQVEAGNVGRHYFNWRYNVTEFQLLGINDFHGRLLPEKVSGVDRGGAAYLGALINQLRGTNPNTLLIHAGDSVGASQLQSALLQDEPTLQIFNLLKFDAGSVGNHEFDKGLTEALRLIKGGKNPVRGTDWAGVNFPYLVSNLEYKDTGQPPLQPYVIVDCQIPGYNVPRVAQIGSG